MTTGKDEAEMSEDTAALDRALQEVFFDRYPAEAITLLERMHSDQAAETLLGIPLEKSLKLWERLSPEYGARLLQRLPTDYAGRLLEQLDPNRAAGYLRGLEEEERESILACLNSASQQDLRRAIAYPEDSAGAMMDTRIMYFRPGMTVTEALDILRTRVDHAYHKLYTVDDENRIHGILDIEELAIADRDTRLAALERTEPVVVDAMSDREELVELFERYRMTDLPVVDFERRLLGVLRYHVLVGAALEESSADLQTMVGVSKDERALSPVLFATRKRLPWLQVNLATAFLAAAVVGLFENTIAQYTALAVLLPVVAGQSGNTGAQALAVTMRGLALKEVYPRMWLRVVSKELNVGFLNGIAVALTTGAGVYVWSQSPWLALIIILSMVLSMVIASVAGAAIPILLTLSGQDPAQSSSIFLTTITDIAGFFSFLGIATLFLGMLQ